jgi:DNA-binding NtrC family response regulator
MMPYPDGPAVLIVDDEILIRMAAAEAFVDAGFLVHEAEHADHALLVAAGAGLLHLLFTDVNMPGSMDGVGLAEQLKAVMPKLHVIISSALPVPRRIDHLSATFVAKPYAPEAVCRTAKRLLAA